MPIPRIGWFLFYEPIWHQTIQLWHNTMADYPVLALLLSFTATQHKKWWLSENPYSHSTLLLHIGPARQEYP
jgi:hypothetical protein